MPFEYNDVDDITSSYGYEPRTTPVDVLIDGPVAMGLAAAHFMEHGDDPCET